MPVSIPYTFTQTDDTIELHAQIHSGTVSKATVNLLGQGSSERANTGCSTTAIAAEPRCILTSPMRAGDCC